MYQECLEYDMCSTASFSKKSHHKKTNKTRSNRSSKCSSLKGSADHESRLKFKTESCKYWLNETECPYGQNCNFAHGDCQVRTKNHVPSRYKTKPCQKYNEEGFCPYGLRCQFVHAKAKGREKRYQTAVECISESVEMFYCYLEQKELNTGKQSRLTFFQRVTGGLNINDNDSVIEEIVDCEQESQNYVDVRSRHNSF